MPAAAARRGRYPAAGREAAARTGSGFPPGRPCGPSPAYSAPSCRQGPAPYNGRVPGSVAGGENPGRMSIEHRKRPCAKCPWRRDCDLSVFGDDDFRKLARVNGVPGDEAPVGTPPMACHLDQEDTAHPLRLRAGWLAVVGHHSLTMRLRVMMGDLPADALGPGPGWPALYQGLAEMLAARPRSRPGSPGRSGTELGTAAGDCLCCHCISGPVRSPGGCCRAAMSKRSRMRPAPSSWASRSAAAKSRSLRNSSAAARCAAAGRRGTCT